MDEQVVWITPRTALGYLQMRFRKMGRDGPSKSTLSRWFQRGLIRSDQRRFHSFRLTTYDWIDEAIMWKRIPPRKNRPAIARVVERDDYVATQEALL